MLLILVSLLGLFVLGLIVLVGALLANPRTRAIAALLLLVPVGLVLMAVLFVGFARVSYQQPAVVRNEAIGQKLYPHVEQAVPPPPRRIPDRSKPLPEAAAGEYDGPVDAVEDVADDAVEVDADPVVVKAVTLDHVIASGIDPAHLAGVLALARVAELDVLDQVVVAVVADSAVWIVVDRVVARTLPHAGESDGPVDAVEDTADDIVEAGLEEEEAADKPVEEDNLSVEIRTPPDWVNRQPYKENGQYYWPVTTGPRQTRTECDEVLPQELFSAVYDYIDQKLMPGQSAAHRVPLSQDYIRQHMVGEDIWVEPASTSFGPMVQMHALVKFDREANQRIGQKWQEVRTGERLAMLGIGSGFVLFLLTIAYSYLKIDLKTAGAYRWRLRFGATTGILCAVYLFMVVAQHVPFSTPW